MSAREGLPTTARDGGSVDVAGAVIDHLDLWTGAVTKKSSSGRGSNGKIELTGVKKLREFILELALRGKLTEQLPTDEPAQEFLERAKAEREALGEGSATRKRSAIPPVDAKPFAIPKVWSWERFGDIGLIASSRRVRQRDWQDHGIPFYRAREIVKLSQQGHVNNELFISENLFRELAQNGHIPEVNDLMLTGVGTIGVPYIVKQDDRFYFKDASVLIFKNFLGVCPQFLYYFCHSPFWKKSIHEDSMGTTVHTLTIVRANQALIPVPPVEEQHRIVQKVDELMALCDRLERQTSDQREAHETLVDTLLGSLLKPAEGSLTQSGKATELADNWARLAAHFDTLFTTEQSIDKLKQTILQLAVMGRLVEQDAGDEPAAKLQRKIKEEKSRLVEAGGIKRQKSQPAITGEETPFSLPANWIWARWDDLCIKIGDIDHKMPPTAKNGFPYVSPRDFLPGNGINFDDAKKVSEDDFRRLAAKIQPCRGDIIYPRYGTIGDNRLVETDIEFLASYSCAVIKPLPDLVSSQFFYILSLSGLTKAQSKAAENKTTQANVGIGSIKRFLFPLPPIAEQHRIVQKVDELMALCDQLKERLNQAGETRCQLAETIVEGALQ